MSRPVAVVTGASSGIGAATARALAAAGYEVVLGARRVERIESLAAEIGASARAHRLDVADERSVEEFCAALTECRVLVNCAGGALGFESVADADVEKWRAMFESNVLGTLRMVRALLPALVASGDGHVVTVGSVAAFEPYVGGGGYNAAKHATRALMDVLRLELLGEPVRVSEIDPGMVETEFSLVRFEGDAARATAVYERMTPLSADDVAECIAFVVSRPSHVDVDQMVIRPRDQVRVGVVHRHP
ncbi:MAG: SDR family NAD(P)-dependent oxidoreductase [Actinomycetota bacterium]|nr:SDR family NAD(P)-dependent oxidoreductase [Actinomycetota bacterium]